MRNNYGTANDICNRKNFLNLLIRNTGFMALAQVILYTIVATQYHRTGQTNHFLGFYIQATFGVAIGIQVEKPFDDLIITSQYFLER
jgi:hypothetical protein